MMVGVVNIAARYGETRTHRRPSHGSMCVICAHLWPCDRTRPHVIAKSTDAVRPPRWHALRHTYG